MPFIFVEFILFWEYMRTTFDLWIYMSKVVK